MRPESEISIQKAKRWGTWFKRACQDAGLKTQEEVKQATGFSRIQIQRWMSGQVRPREENIPLLAEALQKDLKEVFTEAGYAYYPDSAQGADTPSDSDLTDEEREEFNSAFEGIPPALRPLALKQLKAFHDSIPDPGEAATFGRGTGSVQNKQHPRKLTPEDEDL